MLLQEAYSQGVFKVGLLEQPTLLGSRSGSLYRDIPGNLNTPRPRRTTPHINTSQGKEVLNSSLERSATSIEALFKLTESIHCGDVESTKKYHTQRYVSAVQVNADPLPSFPLRKRKYETRGTLSFDTTFISKKQRTLHVKTEDVPMKHTGFP